MSLEPHQIALGIFELLLVLGGAALWMRALMDPALRTTLFSVNRLPHWNIAGPEVALLIITMFLCGWIGALLMFRWAPFDGPVDREGMMIIYNGIGFHGFALLGWPVFHRMRRNMNSDFGTKAAIDPATARRGSPWEVLRSAVVTLLLALPVVMATSVIWTAVLKLFGIETEPQDLLGIFGRVESPLVLAGMFLIACVVAPMNEELIFRGVLFRFFRQRFGRAPALIIPAALFGALHGNLGGFVPLALLGAGLALAYEQTGDLRVPMVAHALFNLNSIAVLLSGLATS